MVRRGNAYFKLGAYALAADDLEIVFKDQDASVEIRHDVFRRLMDATCALGDQDRAIQLYEEVVLERTITGRQIHEPRLIELQTELQAAGLYSGPLDGKLSPAFHRAVRMVVRSECIRRDDAIKRG